MIKSSKSSTIMKVGRKAEHDFKGLIVPLLKKWDKESDDPEHMIRTVHNWGMRLA